MTWPEVWPLIVASVGVAGTCVGMVWTGRRLLRPWVREEARGVAEEVAGIVAAKVDKLANNDFPHVLASIERGRTEAREELQEVRTDMREELQQVRTDMREELKQVRTDMREELQQVRTDMREELKQVRTDMREELQEVRTDMREMRSLLLAIHQHVAALAVPQNPPLPAGKGGNSLE